MSWIVVGASSGLGRALAARLAEEGKRLLLVARDERDLAPLAADLRLRFGAEVQWCAADASDARKFGQQVLRAAGTAESVEGILFPIGANQDDDRADLVGSGADRLVSINFLSVSQVIGDFLPSMLSRGRGTIVGFGSVAATRGRTNNAMYAASKAALQRLFESIRHAGERRGILVQFYVLGYLDTNLAFGRKLLFPKAEPRRVAAIVVRNLTRGGGTWYLPKFWWAVATLVRVLPWPIFKRLDF